MSLKAHYLNKSGDVDINKENLIENEHGFANYKIIDGEFVICQVCGDGEYWDKALTDIARSLGHSRVSFYTRRQPRAFLRKYGYSLVGYVLGKEI